MVQVEFKITEKRLPMISFLPFDKLDYDQLITWVTDEEMLMQFAGPHFHFPLTAEQFDLSFTDKKRIPYKILHIADRVAIGHAEIVLQDASTILLSRILIGNMAYRGISLGQPLMNELLLTAFNHPGIQEVSLNVFDWNIPAIKSYKKAGFRINEGKTLTRHINGKTWIAINMVIDRRAWESLQKAV
jgi:RimJ/RimL family protein N-acetyltransferase